MISVVIGLQNYRVFCFPLCFPPFSRLFLVMFRAIKVKNTTSRIPQITLDIIEN